MDQINNYVFAQIVQNSIQNEVNKRIGLKTGPMMQQKSMEHIIKCLHFY